MANGKLGCAAAVPGKATQLPFVGMEGVIDMAIKNIQDAKPLIPIQT